MDADRSSKRTLLSFTFVEAVEEPNFSKEAIIPRNIRTLRMETMMEASTKPTMEPNTTRQNLRDLVSGLLFCSIFSFILNCFNFSLFIFLPF